MKIQTPLKLGGLGSRIDSKPLGLLSRSAPKPLPGRVLRALAVATAHLDTVGALQMAIQSRDAPWKAIEAFSTKSAKGKLQDALDALAAAEIVVEAEVDDRVAATARTVNADPKLTTIAIKILDQDPKTADAVLGWVASVDRIMLERAARAAAGDGLILVPTPQSIQPVKENTDRLNQLFALTQELKDQQDQVLDRLATVEAKVGL